MNLPKILQGYVEMIEMEGIPTVGLATISGIRAARLIQFKRDPTSVSVATAQKIINGIVLWKDTRRRKPIKTGSQR